MSDTVNHICNYYIKGSTAEIETPTHWDLIGSSTNVALPVSSPSSILPPPSSDAAFITYSRQQNNGALYKHVIISLFFYFDIIS
jgi:hypothetical protein